MARSSWPGHFRNRGYSGETGIPFPFQGPYGRLSRRLFIVGERLRARNGPDFLLNAEYDSKSRGSWRQDSGDREGDRDRCRLNRCLFHCPKQSFVRGLFGYVFNINAENSAEACDYAGEDSRRFVLRQRRYAQEDYS